MSVAIYSQHSMSSKEHEFVVGNDDAWETLLQVEG